MDFIIVEQKVNNALNKLKEHDSILLKINVNERSISHKLAEYLQSEFSSFHVDCEYNRHLDLTKTLDVPKDPINWNDLESKTIFPDIIIHQRSTNEENLLIIEMKKSSNRTNRQFDMSKIKAMMMEPYNYDFGLFLEINVNDGDDLLEWYKKNE
jgi:hypothetical protein